MTDIKASNRFNWAGDVLPAAGDTIKFDINSPMTSDVDFDPAFGGTFAGLEYTGGPPNLNFSRDITITGTATLAPVQGTLKGTGTLTADKVVLGPWGPGKIENTVQANTTLEVNNTVTVSGTLVNKGTGAPKPGSVLKLDGGTLKNEAGATWNMVGGATIDRGTTGTVTNKGLFLNPWPKDPAYPAYPDVARVKADFVNTEKGVVQVEARLVFAGGTLTQDATTAKITLPYLPPSANWLFTGYWTTGQLNARRGLWVQNFDLQAGGMEGPGVLESPGVKLLGTVTIADPDNPAAAGIWNIRTTEVVKDLLFTIPTNSTATYQPTNETATVFQDASVGNQGTFQIRKEMRVLASVDMGLTNSGTVSQSNAEDIVLVNGSVAPYKIYNAGRWVKEYAAGMGKTQIDGKFSNAGTVEVRGGGLLLRGGGVQSGMYTLQYTTGTPENPVVVQADLDFSTGVGINQRTTYDWQTGLQFQGGNDFTILDGATVNVLSASTVTIAGKLYVRGLDTKVQGPGSIDAVSLTWSGGEFVGVDPAGLGNPTGGLTAGTIRVNDPEGGNPTYGVETRYQLTARDKIEWDTTRTIQMRGSSSITTQNGATVLNPPVITNDEVPRTANVVRITGGTWGANPDGFVLPFLFSEGVEFRNDGGTVEMGGHAFEGGYVQSAGSAVLNDEQVTVIGTKAELTGGTMVLKGGTLVLAPKVPLNLDGAELSGFGSIQGDVSAVNCTIRIGSADAPGAVLAVSGDFQQLNGTSQFYIGGAAAGVNYSQLQVGGRVTFNGGTVNVNVVGGYVPPIGSRYVLFTAANAQAATPTLTGLDFGDPGREFQEDRTGLAEFAVACVAK